MITPIDNWTLGIMSAYNIYTCEFYIYTEKLLLHLWILSISCMHDIIHDAWLITDISVTVCWASGSCLLCLEGSETVDNLFKLHVLYRDKLIYGIAFSLFCIGYVGLANSILQAHKGCNLQGSVALDARERVACGTKKTRNRFHCNACNLDGMERTSC